jgi:hypothetical protein
MKHLTNKSNRYWKRSAERILHNIWILEVIRHKDPKNITAASLRAYLQNNKLSESRYPEPRAS